MENIINPNCTPELKYFEFKRNNNETMLNAKKENVALEFMGANLFLVTK